MLKTTLLKTRTRSGVRVRGWVGVGLCGLLMVGCGAQVPAKPSASAPLAAQAAVNAVSVMPLGDSITVGYNDLAGGYRRELFQKLSADGLAVDFVGSQNQGPADLRDKDHEGHSGWRIDQIAAQMNGWANTYQPQYVLLMIGTNDIGQNNDLPGAPGRLSALLDQITNKLPGSQVLVATLTLRTDGKDDQVVQFNNALRATVQAKLSAGRKVKLVEMHSALNGNDLPDGLHPSASGYTKMANTWYAALRPLLSNAASVPLPTNQNVQIVNKASNKCLDVYGGPSATGDNVPLVQWDCLGRDQTNQLFKFVPVSSGYYNIQAQHSGKILAVTQARQDNFAPVAQWQLFPE